jgi:hypothetical protein
MEAATRVVATHQGRAFRRASSCRCPRALSCSIWVQGGSVPSSHSSRPWTVHWDLHAGTRLKSSRPSPRSRVTGPDDLMRVTFALGAENALPGGQGFHAGSGAAGHAGGNRVGEGREFAEIVESQGGDPSVVEDTRLLPTAPVRGAYVAPEASYIGRVSPRVVGHGIILLGGGRRTMEE